MHELSLMENVMAIIQENAQQNNINRVSKVKIILGQLSMAVPDSLQFAFTVLSEDPLFKGSVLEIEERPIVCFCNICQRSFTPPDSYSFLCPDCNNYQVEIVSGRELYLDYYEGEEI